MIKEFKLGGVEYSVIEVNDIEGNKFGQTWFGNNIIEIADNINNRPQSKTSKDQTLYHEVVHCILDELGYHSLSSDENLVQGFACLLHQFEVTKK